MAWLWLGKEVLFKSQIFAYNPLIYDLHGRRAHET